jgi:nucleotide-binding universal stress UspA family protein
MMMLKNVLVATDFGDLSDVALQYGRELARPFGATLHVLHVVADYGGNFGSWPGYIPYPGHLQLNIQGAAKRHLDTLVSDDDRRTLHAQPAVITAMGVAQTIVKYAGEILADIIVVGTHGRGPVAHFMIGSVAERVVRSAPCPVLTVRHPEREFVQPDSLQAAAHG